MQVTLECPICEKQVFVVVSVKTHRVTNYIADVYQTGQDIKFDDSTWRPAVDHSSCKYVCPLCGYIFANNLDLLHKLMLLQHSRNMTRLIKGIN